MISSVSQLPQQPSAARDDLRITGALAGAGLGYRYPFADIFELRAHLLVGAFFAWSRDALSGTASAGGPAVPVDVANSSKTVSSADLFVMPELHLGLRFGGFGVSLGLAAAIFALQGPHLETGDVSPTGTCEKTNPTAVECAGGKGFLQGERAYGPFVLFVPGVSAGYLF